MKWQLKARQDIERQTYITPLHINLNSGSLSGKGIWGCDEKEFEICNQCIIGIRSADRRKFDKFVANCFKQCVCQQKDWVNALFAPKQQASL